MPATWPSSPSMTMQPMSCCSSNFATSSNDLSAVVVTTFLPFTFRIAATCISFPPASITSVHDRLRHRALIDNATAYLFQAELVSAGLATVGDPFPAAISIYASARPDVLTSTFGTLNGPPQPGRCAQDSGEAFPVIQKRPG